MLRKLVIILLAGLFLIPSLSFAAKGKSLFEKYWSKAPVKVYIKGFTDESGNKVPLDIFKKEVEKAYSERKSINFDVVGKPEESDITVSGVVKKYQYLERGPFKPSIGIETTAIDAVATMTGNYIEMEVETVVTDSKTNDVLWKDGIENYIKRKMSPEEGMTRIFDKIARDTVARPFAKPKK